jgi:hypothetical protein
VKILTEFYQIQNQRWPTEGRHIMAHYDETSVVVYQAYRPGIGHFAARHGYFGGDFKMSRMSWFKPNFLWMMYRSGWGTKPDQEVTLAVHIKREFFETVLKQAVPSTYKAELYESEKAWKRAVINSDVRLQWDPDHSPWGKPVERRAIQLGLRGGVLAQYAQDAIIDIEDISDFVASQRPYASFVKSDKLQTPIERPYIPGNPDVAAKLGLDSVS